MIRGVNKNVIEISDTGNDCFERAILFVRPERATNDSDQIHRRASDYLSGIRLRPWINPNHKVIMRVLGWLCAAAVGGGVTAIAFLL